MFKTNCAECKNEFETEHNPTVYPLGLLCENCRPITGIEPLDKAIRLINVALKPSGLHLCWITEDGNREPISYGFADVNGDEVDIGSVIQPDVSNSIENIEAENYPPPGGFL
jgi:hypothetical protein